MCRTRSEFEGERILSVVFYPDLGLCIELGDEKIDKEVYGYRATQDFIEAVAKEVGFHIENTILGPEGHPTLRKVQRRFQ